MNLQFETAIANLNRFNSTVANEHAQLTSDELTDFQQNVDAAFDALLKGDSEPVLTVQ